jgi:hypothetical protein
MRRNLARYTVVAMAALALAGCTAGKSAATAAAPSPGASGATAGIAANGAPVSASPAAGGSVRSSAPSTNASPPLPCTTAQLAMSVPESTSAKFQEAGNLVLTNRGTAPCTLSGYPTLQLGGPSGPLPTTVSAQAGPITTVNVPPGQSASSMLIWNKYEDQGNTCPPYPTSVTVTPPGQDAGKTIPWVPDIAGSVCGGLIRVSPIVAGV